MEATVLSSVLWNVTDSRTLRNDGLLFKAQLKVAKTAAGSCKGTATDLDMG